VRCHCLVCDDEIFWSERTDKLYCTVACRSKAWSRADRAEKRGNTDSVWEQIQDFLVGTDLPAIGYALEITHPAYHHRTMDVCFPEAGRRTKRAPDASGRVRLRSTPYFLVTPFEAPRVPVVGDYRLILFLQGGERRVTNQVIRVGGAFPSVRFYDDKGRYDIAGNLVQKQVRNPTPKGRSMRAPRHTTQQRARTESMDKENGMLPIDRELRVQIRRKTKQNAELSERIVELEKQLAAQAAHVRHTAPAQRQVEGRQPAASRSGVAEPQSGARGPSAARSQDFAGVVESLRKERGPLPIAEVAAYMHCVLGAFGYMHRLGLIYNDFKPDNVMLEVDDIKVIDLGGVTRASNTDGDIYSTVGYAAPELATKGPSPASDIYTLARTMAVLCTEFKGFQTTNEHKLLTPDEEPVYAQYESFYRFLLKATHENPNMRFQSADEMDEQLLGVMRDAVAIDSGKACPGNSGRFGYDRMLERDVAQQQVVDISSLPRLRMDTQDPAAAIILNSTGGGSSADLKRQEGVIVSALEQYPDSHEAKLALARNLIEQGQYDKGEATLKEIEAADAFDWRVIWYRGVSFLARGQYDSALSAFDTCFDEVPGELAPRLALAVASELKKSADDAIHFYRSVSRVDPGYATALFGQARLLAAQGKTNEAVMALAMVPQTSSLYVDAQKALAKTLINGGGNQKPAADDLNKAAQTIEALVLTGIEKLTMVQELFTAALSYVTSKQGALKLLDKEVPEMEVRTRLETAYRDLARLAHDDGERIRLVDLANQVRPRTAF